jgi:hypothetical protein
MTGVVVAGRGELREGVARPEFPSAWQPEQERMLIMINNSSLRKWQRLSQKQLDQQFTHEMVHGLQCSPFEATAILDAVYRVYAPYFETSGTLKPGQILFQVISVEAPPSTRLADGKQVTVALTFDAGQEDLEVRRRRGVPSLRRHRMQRMAVEAFQQGGLLTIEDLANRLFNCGQRTLSRDLDVLRREGIVLPLRSTMKDMGRSICHRSLIVEQWLQGKEYSEIAASTHHSVSAVQNYLSKFKRVIALAAEGYDVHTIAFLVKVSAALAESYHALYQTVKAVPHRRKELRSFLKKGAPDTPIRRST